MEGRQAWTACQVGLDPEAWNPGEALAGEHKRPRVAVFTRDVGIDEDVLQLAGAATAQRPQPEARRAVAEVQVEPRQQVGGVGFTATVTGLDDELRRELQTGMWLDHLQMPFHNTKTQAARKIDATSTRPSGRELEHGVQLGPRKPGLAPAGARVKDLQDLHRERLRHPAQRRGRDGAAVDLRSGHRRRRPMQS